MAKKINSAATFNWSKDPGERLGEQLAVKKEIEAAILDTVRAAGKSKMGRAELSRRSGQHTSTVYNLMIRAGITSAPPSLTKKETKPAAKAKAAPKVAAAKKATKTTKAPAAKKAEPARRASRTVKAKVGK